MQHNTIAPLNVAGIAERFRPQTWDDVVAQPKAVTLCRKLAERGEVGGQSYILSGDSGTGKSSIAMLLAREVADPFCIEQIAGNDLTMDRLRQIRETMQYFGGTGNGKTGRAWIIEEFHGMGAKAIDFLNAEILERMPQHCTMIFTSTGEGVDLFGDARVHAEAFLSRCITIRLARRDLSKAFAARIKGCMESIGLDGLPVAKYQRIVADCGNNCRKAFQESYRRALEGGAE